MANTESDLRTALLDIGPAPDQGPPPDYQDIPAIRGASDDQIVALIRPYAAEPVDLDDPTSWLPIHAWRIAAKRRVPGLIPPMLDVADHEDDYIADREFPSVCAMIGLGAVDVLLSAFVDPGRSEIQRTLIARGLGALAPQFDEPARGRVIQVLNDQLTSVTASDPDVNAASAEALMALNARESADIVLRAFKSGRISLGLIRGQELERFFSIKDD